MIPRPQHPNPNRRAAAAPAGAPVIARTRRQLDVRLLISSGAIEARPVPSVWRSLLAWLLGPSPFRSPLADASPQFSDTTQVLP